MIDLDMVQNESLNGAHREADLEPRRTCLLGTLKQAAVDEHRAPIAQPQLMAGTCHAVHGPVMQNHWHCILSIHNL